MVKSRQNNVLYCYKIIYLMNKARHSKLREACHMPRKIAICMADTHENGSSVNEISWTHSELEYNLKNTQKSVSFFKIYFKL